MSATQVHQEEAIMCHLAISIKKVNTSGSGILKHIIFSNFYEYNVIIVPLLSCQSLSVPNL
jgi:hypothetical protein